MMLQTAMQRVVAIVAVGIFVIALGAAVVQVGLMGYGRAAAGQLPGLQAESRAYVDQAVVDITRNWDQAELVRRASPELLKHASPQQLSVLFRSFARFGNLVHYDGAQGKVIKTVVDTRGSEARAEYDATATFGNGPAHVIVNLAKYEGRWMIEGFYLRGPVPVANSLVKQL